MRGDDVDWYDPMFDMYDTDIFYESKIFTFSPDYRYYPVGATIIRGGTGIEVKSKLPDAIEQVTDLDYSLYPDCDYSIQFMSRGCIRKCPFCVVPIKEGAISQSRPFELNPISDEIASHLVCPVCKMPIVNVWSRKEYRPRYCHVCGQRLDWSDTGVD